MVKTLINVSLVLLTACASIHSGVDREQAKLLAGEYLTRTLGNGAAGYVAGAVQDGPKPGHWGVPFWGPNGTHDLRLFFVNKKTGEVTHVKSVYGP